MFDNMVEEEVRAALQKAKENLAAEPPGTLRHHWYEEDVKRLTERLLRLMTEKWD